MHATEASVLLLDHDPDLASELREEDLAVARRHVRARAFTVDAGVWRPPAERDRSGDLGLLVLDGVMAREISVRGRWSAELVGAGDLVRPWDRDEELGGSVDHEERWEVLTPVRVAEIDARLATVLAQWPSIASRLVTRSVRRARALGFQHAIGQVAGVDVRLHLILWHLADRWGRVTRDGVLLPLPLTHRVLGLLIGARRPSVTSALRRLERDGYVQRTEDDEWLLHGAPSDVELQHDSKRRRARLGLAA